MKVGRREFLNLLGAAVARPAVPSVLGHGSCADCSGHSPPDRGHPILALVDKHATRIGKYWHVPSWLLRVMRSARQRGRVVEYDRDFYNIIAQGERTIEWTDALTGVVHRLDFVWFDHGLHTSLFCNADGSTHGHLVGTVLSTDADRVGAGLGLFW